MIAPMLFGLGTLFIWPVFQTIYFSFTKWGDFGNYSFSGLDNYRKMLQDPNLLKALYNTLTFVIYYVPSLVVLSILFAVLLNQKIRGVVIYRTIFFLPAVMLPTAVAMGWKWLFNADYGLINTMLRGLLLSGLHWLTDPKLALLSVVIVAVWSAHGLQTVILLSGLQGIATSYYEAASIEGAGPFTRFFRITLPLLTPTIFFVSITSLIHAFQLFDLIYMMIGDITIDEAQTVVYLFYKESFVFNNKGYGSAIAVVLFIIILLVTALQMRLQKKWVFYE
jgi:multiple sugar transport system permease protein